MIFFVLIEKEGLGQIIQFVSKRWSEVIKDPNNKIFENLPSKFWMNSIGGSAGKGKWITMLMYTENEQDALAFKEVLMRWQAKGHQQNEGPPDLIQIGKPK